MVSHSSTRAEMESGALFINTQYKTYEGIASLNRTHWTIKIGHTVLMEKPKDRLKQARAAAGYETPSDAAKAHARDLNKNTLISHENGNRDISRKAALKYARVFGVDAGWLLYGASGMDRLEVQTWEALLGEALEQAVSAGVQERDIHKKIISILEEIERDQPEDMKLVSEVARRVRGMKDNQGGDDT